MKLKILAILFVCFISIDAYCIYKKDSIPIYKIVNKELEVILDSFINDAKQYNDFNNIVSVSIINQKGNILQLSYHIDTNKLIIYDDMVNNKTTGIVFYDSISIIIFGRGVIDEKILSRTNLKCNILVRKREYIENNKEYVFPIKWLIRVKNDKLEVISKYERTTEE